MTTMSRRDWWLGVMVVAGALLLQALLPRYEWHASPGSDHPNLYIVYDRWFGVSTVHRYQPIDPP